MYDKYKPETPTAMERFLNKAGHVAGATITAAMTVGVLTVGAATVMGIGVGSTLGTIATMDYMDGFSNPTQHFPSSHHLSKVGAEHRVAVNDAVQGLKDFVVSVTADLENFSPKVVVQEVSSLLPSSGQISEMKQDVAGQLDELNAKAAQIKDGGLELIHESGNLNQKL